MAATGTPTPNIGLRRPQGTDPASVDDINYNSNLIDTKLGAVGNTSVQAQINSLNSNIARVVPNGNVEQGHIYCLHLVEATIASATFEILYNPNENQGIQNFSVCLTNGTSIFCCTAKISLSNGQLSISEAYRVDTGSAGEQAWNVSIRTIRMIA